MSNKSKPVSLTEQILTNAKSPRVTMDKLSETVPAPDRLISDDEIENLACDFANGMNYFQVCVEVAKIEHAKTSALVRAECQGEIDKRREVFLTHGELAGKLDLASVNLNVNLM